MSQASGLPPSAPLSALIVAVALSACTAFPGTGTGTSTSTSTGAPRPADSSPAARKVGLPNPATVACLRAGGSAFNEHAPDGSERGLCRFPSGQICDQWAVFRSECGPTPVDRRSGS